jgi:hypothetical protein
METRKVVRLNADLAPDVANLLKDMAETQHISLSEAVRRAISNEAYLQKKRSAGGKVFIEERNGTVKELVFMR